MATEDTYVATRAERILGTMVITIVVFSVLAFIAIITAGITQLDLTSPIGSAILVLPGIGLPIAFVLMIALLILNMIRRRKNASAGSR
ncbi:TRAP-type C4-dicarboxylate transport system permease small subunit [Aurantimicrobium minutum]|uniref:hypothetical protein n=1 Tax=Aurantimicrobium minutum TaxID=708131 RepID=UPI002473FB7E|nr:hypothetical protein [Aurantimicrobium minutum]MDH6532439.1 TRAP-type C4-dicarboxylate transport system permease small subunit [Aurantimicrobium minutum]